MRIMAMYTTTCIRIVCTNSLVLLGLAALSLVVGVRVVPLGFTRLVTLITLVTIVTLITLPVIIFLQSLGIGRILLCKHLALRGRKLLGLRMHGKLRH